MQNIHDIEISPGSYEEELRSDTDFPYEAIVSVLGRRGEYLAKWVSLKTRARLRMLEAERKMRSLYPKLFVKYMTEYEIALTPQQADKMLKSDPLWTEAEKEMEEMKVCAEIADKAIKFFEGISYDAKLILETEKSFCGGI